MPDVAMPIKTERRALDTMSQTSEGTTTTSTSDKSGCDNREDLKDLAAKLGITNLEDMHQERFRVDRQKLEYMLLGVPIGEKGGQPAETFFHKVMEETNTWVSWPARLKIGAKSRKDPHIKVAGRPDDVRACKEKIMEVLDTRNNNRVTMKLDVSYTDHSHIIGKGGLTIKKVMEETGCHIHFPDSNRSNHQEKSNQVSIAGEMEGVERARARVRNLTPLIFSFELPIMSSLQGVQDAMSPYIVKIQEKYNVQVMFRTRPKLHDTLVVVKGCEWEVSQVKEATVLLINDMCKNLANQIQVQMSMEISPQHHSIVLGKQSQNLKMIMQRTGTQIMFPDAGDPNIPSLKKSNVTITGSIHNVYIARQHLVGSLPLVLMFDLPEESIGAVDTEKIDNLMQSLDVYINVRHKPKQSTLSVIIKGIERNASNIYEARKHLLKLDEPRVHAEIPATYHIPNASAIFNNTSSLNGMMGSVPDNFSTTLSVNTQTPPYCMSPMQSPNPMNLSPHWGFPSIPSMFSQIPFNQAYGPYPSLSHMLTTQHMLQNGMLPPGLTNHNFTGFNPMHALNPGLHGLNNLNANMSADSKDSGAFSSLSSATSSLSSPALSPRNVSPVNTEGAPPGLDLSSMLVDLSMNDRRAPGCEKKSLELASQHLTPYDYDQKKLLAIKAMQSKIDPKVSRNPTSSWVGYGLSHSTPTVGPNFKDSANKSDLWNDPPTPVFNTTMDFGVNPGRLGMASNHLDQTPGSVVNKIQQDDSNDVASILTKIGVQKYMHLFIENEIDMATFQTLTENDLYQIGITAWGARRRILLKIAELNARSSTFSGSAAPGAERKLSSTTSSTLTSGAFSNSIGSSMEKW